MLCGLNVSRQSVRELGLHVAVDPVKPVDGPRHLVFGCGMWLGLTYIDWAVIGVYLVLVTGLGILAYTKVKDRSDYFMGGRRFGKIFMLFFAFGAGTSSEQASSVVAGTWRVGLAGIWWQFLWLWATPFYWLVAPVMRRMRALTTSDFFEARYSRSTAILYSVWGIIMAIVFIAGALYSSGKMVDALTGGQLTSVADESILNQYRVVPFVERVNLDEDKQVEGNVVFTASAVNRVVKLRAIRGYEIAILAITLLFVTYGMAGGLGAAIWTDFVQGILTIVFSFLLLPFVLREIGGFALLNPVGENPIKSGMFDLVASAEVAEMLGREPITIFYVFMLSLVALTGIVVQPHIMGVCGAGKTEFEGRFGFTFGNFVKRFCTIAWTFTALACIVWYLGPESPLRVSDNPEDRAAYAKLRAVVDEDFSQRPIEEQEELNAFDKEFSDRLFGRAAYDILPTIAPGLVGLLLASLLAAMMSTCDAQMIVGSGLFTEHIYKGLFRRNASEHHYVWVGRLSGLGIVLAALVMQTMFTDVIHALRVILKTPAMIGISLWIGLVWRGWTPIAVWVSSIAATVVWAVCDFAPEAIENTGFLGFMLRGTGDTVRVTDVWTMVAFMSAGFVSGLAASFITPRTPTEKLDHFFRLMRTPVREGEVVPEPCTLPEDAADPIPKLFNHPDIEIPRPTLLDMGGFAGAWVLVGLIIGLTYWLAQPS